MISLAEALSFIAFSPDEERALEKLEAATDAMLHEKFVGAPLRVRFPNDDIPQKLAYALQRKYEQEGTWRVAVGGDRDFLFSPVYFTPPAAKITPKRTELPRLEQLSSLPIAPDARRLLVRMPTRSRPAQALSVLAEYRRLAGTAVKLEVVIDEDDPTMRTAPVVQRLVALDCTITNGGHRSKIEACNGGRVNDWDILLLASDDMVPVTNGYALRVIAEMERHFPLLDGAIYFDDGYQHANLCTLPILGRRLYNQFGFVYERGYKSLFCDAEQTELLIKMGRLAYVNEKIIEHRHPAAGRAKRDSLYDRNDALWNDDQRLFEARRKRGFDYAAPLLSICIATIPERRRLLDRLADHLFWLIDEVDRKTVEVVLDQRVDVPIGTKRQALLERSRGQFVSFVDDDDWVSSDYVYQIVDVLAGDPTIDCAPLVGVMTTAGEVPETFHHSIRNIEWRTEDGVHYRTPNHLNAVRRDLALAAGFRSLDHGEDFDYSERLKPLLRTEAKLATNGPLYFYFYQPGKPKREDPK